jgi:MATE family multidrug resistance protein
MDLGISPPARRENWWNRPCGPAEVLQIALPMMISTGFWSLQWFVDRMFLLWYSGDAMSAAFPAGMLHWTMICLLVGIASYVNTFVAQYYGARHRERIGLAVALGVRLSLLLTPLFLLSIPLAPLLLAQSGATAEIGELSVQYFQILAFGAGGTVLSNALSSFYTGRGLTRVVMIVQGFATALNLVLDYLLIFGKLGFLEMGIAGAAWATVAAQWFSAAVFWLLMQRPAEREEFGLDDGNRFDGGLFWRLLWFGAPGALPLLIEAAAFSLLTVFVSRLGKVEAASTSLAFNVNAIAFIPVYGVSIAVGTLVGQKLGENRDDLAAKATWTSLALALVYTGFFAVLYVAVPEMFLAAHAAFSDPQEFAAVRATTVVLLRFVAAYCLFDAVQTVFVGALKGAGDTRFVLLATAVISITGVTAGRLVELGLDGGLYGWWWVLSGWLLPSASSIWRASNKASGGRCESSSRSTFPEGSRRKSHWRLPPARTSLRRRGRRHRHCEIFSFCPWRVFSCLLPRPHRPVRPLRPARPLRPRPRSRRQTRPALLPQPGRPPSPLRDRPVRTRRRAPPRSRRRTRRQNHPRQSRRSPTPPSQLRS